ncbi:MAG: hypothetical protein ACLFWB_11595 [Armatimonadota bacterium]
MRVRSINIWSLAKVMACTQAVFCIIAAAAHAAFLDYLTDGQTHTLILAIFWAAFGWVGGLLAGIVWGHLYNATAAFSALPIRLKPLEKGPQPAAPETTVATEEGLGSRAKTLIMVVVFVSAAIWVGLLLPMENTYKAARKYYEEGVAKQAGRAKCYRALQLATSRPYLSLLYPTKRARMHKWAQEARLQLAYSLARSNEPIPAGILATEYLENGGTEEGRQYAQGLVQKSAAQGVTETEIAAARKLRYVVHDTEAVMVGQGRHMRDYKVSGKVTVHNGNSFGLAMRLVCEIPDHGAREMFAVSLGPKETETLEFSYKTVSGYAVTLTPDRVFVYPAGFEQSGAIPAYLFSVLSRKQGHISCRSGGRIWQTTATIWPLRRAVSTITDACMRPQRPHSVAGVG